MLQHNKSVIDYIDTAEEESALIAVRQEDLKKVNIIRILKLTLHLYLVLWEI